MINNTQNRKAILAESIKQRSVIKDPTSKAFKKTGLTAANIIIEELINCLRELDSSLRILDFGAGSGRVALPLINLHSSISLYCNDVDVESIEYLSLNLPDHCEAKPNNYTPPLSYPNEYFNAVYSISVWSHFPEDLGLEWLREMHRITQSGAYLLISKAGFNVLKQWKKSSNNWDSVTEAQLISEKFIYKKYQYLDHNERHYPGIAKKGSWGEALIHDDYIRNQWSKLFCIEDIKAGRMNGMQDLVIMKKV